MTQDGTAKPPARTFTLRSEHIAQLKRERYFEGVVRLLDSQFSNRPQWVEDSVAEAIEKALTKKGGFVDVEHVKRWTYRVAFNRMKGYARADKGLVAWPDEDHDSDFGPRRSTEDEVLDRLAADELYEELRGFISGWSSRKMRAAAAVLVDAAYDEDPITDLAEFQDRLSDLLGEEISYTSASRLRTRARDRLDAYRTGEAYIEDEDKGEEDDG